MTVLKETEFRVWWHTPKQAEAFERRVHNVPDNVRLGWTPYRILVTSAGGTLALTAFYTGRALRRWLNERGLIFRITSRGKGNRWGSLYREETSNA